MAHRTAKTVVRVNVYDLSDANAYIGAFGFGLYHSGVEIGGDEYSFASGAGIFTGPPKQAAGAVFRESIEMGVFEGTYSDARRLAYSLSSDFQGDSYNLFTKNCNTYANALCQVLLNKSIPAYINRAAYWGSFLSCLVPTEASSQAPVGATPALSNGAPRRSDFVYTPFAGNGQTAGGGSVASEGTESLADRREKVRLAALRRLNGQEASE